MDLVLPTVDYTYEHFLADARAATEEILSKGKVPIVIGGTGMYMRWYMQNRQGITSHPYPAKTQRDSQIISPNGTMIFSATFYTSTVRIFIPASTSGASR